MRMPDGLLGRPTTRPYQFNHNRVENAIRAIPISKKGNYILDNCKLVRYT